jgi:membrane protein
MSIKAGAVTAKSFFALLKLTCIRWNDHNVPRLGAALAYYALLSLAPLVILIVAMCGLVLSQTNAESEIVNQTQQLAGRGAALAIQGLIKSTQHRGSGLLPGIIAFATLFFGASGVFSELRTSLNTIWDAPPAQSCGLKGLVKERILCFVMVAALGLFLLASLLVTAAFTFLEKFATDLVPLRSALGGEILNLGLSLVTLSMLFGFIFKFVPHVPIRLRDVIFGALTTSIFFTLGKVLLTLYLGKTALGSVYGAAGSLVALVVWVYYSAQIFFFGAVLTRVYSEIASPTPSPRHPKLPPETRRAQSA